MSNQLQDHKLDSVKMPFHNCFLFALLFIICLAGVHMDYKLYCFKFTWLGVNSNHETATKVNCSSKDYKGVPCIYPIIAGDDVVVEHSGSPNMYKLWEDYKDNPSEIGCLWTVGYTCLKYTYLFNNAIVNTTYFCGKMIEDEKTAITSGCYQQEKNGHTIEACACQSYRPEIPCNT
ncbi:uncharacterized protein [Prorops nasuta]|uniref:uncharacterized protein n=1 Tax=Prorops nasuta TaxID=863751 RepID=UPI0034CF05D6